MTNTFKKIGFAVIITVIGMFSASAQAPKVIALLNKASWCPVCKANGARVEADLMPMLMQNKDVQLVMNDLSNDESKAVSASMLEKIGVTTFARKNTGTGVLYFIDAESKELISKVSVAKSNEEIMMAYQKALDKSKK